MADKHEWLISHGDEGCYACHHEPLSEEEHDTPWLHRTHHVAVLKYLAFVVMDKKLLSCSCILSEFQVTQFSKYIVELPAVSFSHSF